MKVEMKEKGKFSLDGANIKEYAKGSILSDETPLKVRESFVRQNLAVEVVEPIQYAKPKTETLKPQKTKVTKPTKTK